MMHSLTIHYIPSSRGRYALDDCTRAGRRRDLLLPPLVAAVFLSRARPGLLRMFRVFHHGGRPREAAA